MGQIPEVPQLEIKLKGYEVRLYEVTGNAVGNVVQLGVLTNMFVHFSQSDQLIDYDLQPDPAVAQGVVRTGTLVTMFIADSLKGWDSSTGNWYVTTKGYLPGLYEMTLVAISDTGKRSKESDSVVIRLIDLAPAPPRIGSILN